MHSLQTKIWVLEGQLDHNFAEKALLKVAQNMKRIGKVPTGYLYPELLMSHSLPAEMESMLKNKIKRHNSF